MVHYDHDNELMSKLNVLFSFRQAKLQRLSVIAVSFHVLPVKSNPLLQNHPTPEAQIVNFQQIIFPGTHSITGFQLKMHDALLFQDFIQLSNEKKIKNKQTR